MLEQARERLREIPSSVTLPAIPYRTIARVLFVALKFLIPLAGVVAAAAFSAIDYAHAPGVLRPPFDDSYISLNYARNLAEHGKLSFDGQTWSTGATSLLHVGLMALPIKLGAEPFMTQQTVGIACHIGLAVAVYWLGWAMFRSQLAGLGGGLVAAFLNYTAFDAANGLETSLFMALIAASMAAFFTFRGVWGRLGTGFIIGLTVLARPEGVLLLPAAVVYLWITRERGQKLLPLLFEVVALSLPVMAALGGLSYLSWSVNHTLLPGTGSAKLKFFQENRWSMRLKFSHGMDGMGLFTGPLVPAIVAAIIGGRRKEALLPALFLVPLFAIYLMFFPGGLWHYFYRYQHPVLPALAALAGGGLAYLVQLSLRRDVLAKALAVCAIVVFAIPTWKEYETWRTVYSDAVFETFMDLEAMAQELNTIVGPDQTLATHDIGAVGYFAKYRVIDLVGLANPDVIKYHKHREVSLYVDEIKPDYLLVFPEWDHDFLWIDPAAHPDKWEFVKLYPGRNLRIQPYALWRRLPEPPQPPEEPLPPEEP